MATLFTDRGRIQRVKARIKADEAELAKDLYAVFDTGQALQKLKGFARSLVEMMARDTGKLTEAKAANPFLDIWTDLGGRDKGKAGLVRFATEGHFPNFNVLNCAEIIRLFGEWVEKGGTFAKPNRSTHAVKDPSGNGTLNDAKSTYRAGGATVWGQPSRDRTRRSDRNPADRIPRQVKAHKNPHARDHGMSQKRPTAGSTLTRLNNIFGLTVGCDISGTTADALFALNSVSDELGPAYRLLPVATLVSSMHHTLLEAALTMSHKGFIDYSVSFPTTLMSTAQFPPELSEIPRILRRFENRMNDYRFMLCREGMILFGGYANYVGQLRPSLKRIFCARNAATHLTALPTVDNIVRYAHSVCGRRAANDILNAGADVASRQAFRRV